MLHREFPAGASEWGDTVSRRNFLKLAGASLALAGLPGCTKQPTREIYPYVNQAAELVLGEALYYATSMLLGGYATGALVKSREGHPIKVEGSPEHPASLGASSVWLQASILDLYDPDRSKAVARDGEVSTRDSFAADLHQLIVEQRAVQGSGLRFLTETITSPTLAAQLEEVRRRFPKSKWYQYDPVSRDNVREGARLAFGELAEAHYQFDAAEVILSLESDFLHTHPERLRYARHFTDGRRVSAQQKQMNRLYVVESSPSITGSMADHRLRLSSSKVEGLVRLLCNKLGLGVEATPDSSPRAAEPWVELLLNDLRNHRGNSLILAGEYQPPIVHALAHVLNEHLGNAGKTVFYTDPVEARPENQMESLRQLADELRSGTVEALVILGGNPAYTAPADLEFGELLLKVKRSIHLGIDLDETAARCSWHLPAKHYLESWGDARSFDGTISLLQPLIAPLYDGISPHELLGMFIQEQPLLSDYEIVRNFWRSQDQWPDFELGWREALHNGFISNTAVQRKQLRVQGIEKVLSSGASNAAANANTPGGPTVKSDALEICFRPDPNVWDGRFANNGWLQECPKPLSKLTWGQRGVDQPRFGPTARANLGRRSGVGGQRPSSAGASLVDAGPGGSDDYPAPRPGAGKGRSHRDRRRFQRLLVAHRRFPLDRKGGPDQNASPLSTGLNPNSPRLGQSRAAGASKLHLDQVPSRPASRQRVNRITSTGRNAVRHKGISLQWIQVGHVDRLDHLHWV
jgi:molybdopterin-containing oxidoreductase family iron-sulfur binding subunit